MKKTIIFSLIVLTGLMLVGPGTSWSIAGEESPLLSGLLNRLWSEDFSGVLSMLDNHPEFRNHYPNETAVLTVVSLLQKNQFEEAVAATRQFLSDPSLLMSDHLLLFLLDDRLDREKIDQAREIHDWLVSRFSHSPLGFHASLSLAKALEFSGNLDLAHLYLDKALTKALDAEDQLRAKHLLYEILIVEQRYPEAALLLRSLYLDFDSQTFTRTRRMASPLLGNISPADFSSTERLNLGRFFSQLGYRETALFLVEDLDPFTLSIEHQEELGVLLLQIAVNTDNLKQVEEIVFRFPILEGTAAALFYRGVVHQREARYRQAVDHYQTLLDHFPESGYRFNAFRNLVFCYQALGEESTSWEVSERMIEEFPHRGDILWDIFWRAYRRGELDRGRIWLERLTGYPAEHNRAWFWLGKLSSSQDTRRTAIERIVSGDTIDYYYMRAWQEAPSLGVTPSLPDWFPAPSEYQPVFETGTASPTWQRYALLRRIGYLVRSEIELRAYRRKYPEQLGAWWELSELAAHRGDYRQSIVQAILLSNRLEKPYRNIQERIHPDFYLTLVEPLSRNKDLDPYLVLSILRAESSFDDTAVSVAGAVGLMQIMPSTGAWMAERMAQAAGREFNWDTSRLFDPQENISIGVTYLAYLVDMYDGRICPAVCAYNAGPGRVNSWLESLPEDRDEFVESIPFPETRNYIKRVLENYFHYSWLYQGEFTLSPCIF